MESGAAPSYTGVNPGQTDLTTPELIWIYTANRRIWP